MLYRGEQLTFEKEVWKIGGNRSQHRESKGHYKIFSISKKKATQQSSRERSRYFKFFKNQ